MSFKRVVQAAKSILTLNRDREFVELKRMLELNSTDRVLDDLNEVIEKSQLIVVARCVRNLPRV